MPQIGFHGNPRPVGGSEDQRRRGEFDIFVFGIANFDQSGANVQRDPQRAPFLTRTWLVIRLT